MPDIFFTSDTHFDHGNIISYCGRPFKDVYEMNSRLIENWNRKIGSKDTVFFLGDFSWRNPIPFIRELKGDIHFVLGNHDQELIRKKYREFNLKVLGVMHFLKDFDPRITLCHYQMAVWPESHLGSWHLFGHSHGARKPIGLSWDAGVDNNSYAPLALGEIKLIMQRKIENDCLEERPI